MTDPTSWIRKLSTRWITGSAPQSTTFGRSKYWELLWTCDTHHIPSTCHDYTCRSFMKFLCLCIRYIFALPCPRSGAPQVCKTWPAWCDPWPGWCRRCGPHRNSRGGSAQHFGYGRSNLRRRLLVGAKGGIATRTIATDID